MSDRVLILEWHLNEVPLDRSALDVSANLSLNTTDSINTMLKWIIFTVISACLQMCCLCWYLLQILTSESQSVQIISKSLMKSSFLSSISRPWNLLWNISVLQPDSPALYHRCTDRNAVNLHCRERSCWWGLRAVLKRMQVGESEVRGTQNCLEPPFTCSELLPPWATVPSNK